MKRADDIMQTDLITVRESMLLSELERVLIENKITGAPVVNDSGQLVGVVSRSDIVREFVVHQSVAEYLVDYQRDAGLFGLTTPQLEHELATRTAAESASQIQVADLMTREVISVGPDATVVEIATLLRDKHLHRLVVTENNQPVGVVSAIDIVGCVADGALNAE